MTDQPTRAEVELVAQVAREVLPGVCSAHEMEATGWVVAMAFDVAETWLAEYKRRLAEAKVEPMPTRLPTDGAKRG